MYQQKKRYHSDIPELFTIRRGLKSMFHYQDIDSVIDDLCNYQPRYLYKEEIDKQLSMLLRLEPEGQTIDQNEAIAIEFTAACHEVGVFDALFAFVDACCDINRDKVVCRHDYVLRWHEISSLLSEDLLVCAYYANKTHKLSTFDWSPFLDSDRNSLNELLSRELADVHSHLVGSSLNFDINWLCLMNHVNDMESVLCNLQQQLQNNLVSKLYRCDRRSYYTLVVIAAAIRIVLLSRFKCISVQTEDILNKSLESKDQLCISVLASAVVRDIKSFETDAYIYEYLDHKVQYDYAHLAELVPSPSETCAYSTLSGERFILYNTLSAIKDNQLSDWDSTLFYVYLLIKHKIRHEVVQTNDEVGFRNFQLYDQRKILFIQGNQDYNTEYLGLLHHLSVASMFAGHEESRMLETRLTPNNNVTKQVSSIEKQINNPALGHSAKKMQYGFIFHYIKKQDKTPIDMFGLSVRHETLRKDVKKQARAVVEARRLEEACRRNSYPGFPKILGIDAASSEIACRPEVFAQAFRYCRRCIPNIGITYHVGEDFYDIVDGLRAVDECIRFLNLQPQDRLGHALVLGIDVEEYYHNRRNVIPMPKQVALDSTMWLYMMLSGCFANRKILSCLQTYFEYLFKKIYAKYHSVPSIETYYKSWLLRGDNPKLYQVEGLTYAQDDVDLFWNYENLLNNADMNEARSNKEAQILYYYYHHDAESKKKGLETISVKFPPALIRTIKKVQRTMLKKVETSRLQIECNPTSNLKIGDIDRYDEHPIQKFYSKGLVCCLSSRKISSSINTDDKGIFATSIEREYSLMAEALIRKYGGNSKAELKVMKWLERIRECSLKQTFLLNH